MTTVPLSLSCVPGDGWDPAQTGHALFRTRLGVCGIAWGAQAVVALRLPEPSPEGTQMRLLAHARQRRSGLWPQAQAADGLSAQALQAVAGVQWLLAGRPQASDPDRSPPWPDAPAPVLGDLRSLLTLNRWSERSGLPLLDDVVLDWHGVPDFSRAVYQLALAIEPGQTRSYGDLALHLGGKGLARAVGQALGANPFAPVVPCHRILAAQGAGGGFSANGGTRTKLQLLEWEGAPLGDGSSLGLFD
ncbi:methylated-DNA-[protein]-cysteine S-methyltransferase [Comamonas sp. BIGb0152]|uniref:methylated-DNA--[protein]-cysteine S-methyltransferase n=1 Tax=Comamonas sp. BIGb0152 TaxID=2940601 RepID=UPI00216751AA|nr:MGMT family protein [Comamonas sp. BIGb0152]MCS4293464.1 methylated-DNA-[protein]-cysteine S-methyltransferase [Comamonas sp. BIGb0152]